MSPRSGLPRISAEILASLGQHRVLTTEQVRRLHLPGRSSRRAQQLLAHLWAAGLIERVQSPGDLPRRLWFLSQTGARAAKDSGLASEVPPTLDPEQVTGQLQEHTLAVNDSMIQFAEAAHEHGDEFGPLAWRHEVVHPLDNNRGRRRRVLRADAVMTYLRLEGSGVLVEQRFVEVDRATLSADRLTTELAAYAHLFRAEDDQGEPLWRSLYPSFPPVICVLSGAPREGLERRRSTAITLLASDPDLTRNPNVDVLFCLGPDLRQQGPFAPIFNGPRHREPVNWLGRQTAKEADR
ncbi:MAG: replication-relaxation family protein [Solirubrobacterales bacterium]|nr:replication-relaxation family protein [Solirubrobacterales bacterium]